MKSYDELAKIINDWLSDDDDEDDNPVSSSTESASKSGGSSSGYRSLDDAFADLVGE
jgi:hypothetical protein